MRVLLDLFCRRWGWSRAFAARGWKCVGVDLVRPPEIPEGCEFIGHDVFAIMFWGKKLRIGTDHRYWRTIEPDFICASPPCEEFSVHGMKHFHPNPKYPENGIRLFNHTRQLCEASGVPYVMENVRAAQQFVGQAVHHCGPFYLWGNAVSPILQKGITKGLNFRIVDGKRVTEGGRQFSSKSKQRAEETAKLATIPPELANCVAEYAERILEQREVCVR